MRSARARAPCRACRRARRALAPLGRLPWRGSSSRRCDSRATGVVMPPAHASCLAMLAPVFTLQPDGARIYAPAGGCSSAATCSRSRGSPRRSSSSRRRARRAFYRGSVAETLLARRGDPVTRGDLERTRRAGWAGDVPYAGTRFRTRGRAVGCARDAGPAASLARARSSRARARARSTSSRAPRRRAHDEPGRLRRGRARVRAHVEPRPRHRRLPPRPRPAAEQHARRGRPRARAARARASGCRA